MEKFVPTEEAKARPRNFRLPNGKRVGLGGEIVIKRSPPKLDSVIPEATEEEYQMAYESGGLSHIINKITRKKKATEYAIQPDKSDTGSPEGSEETH